TIAESPKVMKAVAAMADVNVSSKKIAQFAIDEMDLARVDDTDVMLIQDQLDVTCAIAIQTSAQKLMFKAWGQSLAMD
ncbi:hypothetical protein PybrP1_006510, partial [[Pythium] brassicae (nom. inval.)]